MSKFTKKPFFGLKAGREGFFYTGRLSAYDVKQFRAILEAMEADLTAAQAEAGQDEKVYIGSLSGRPLSDESKQKFKRPEYAPDLVIDYQTAQEVAEYKAKKARQTAGSDVGF